MKLSVDTKKWNYGKRFEAVKLALSHSHLKAQGSWLIHIPMKENENFNTL